MGFPRPWPTDWPEPPYDDPPETPGTGEGGDDDDGYNDDPDGYPEFRAITWAVNHACNLRCTHCYDVVSYRRGDLSTNDAHIVIDRLFAAGVRFIAFSGGEAFLRRDLLELMAHCRDRGIDFGARSNGTQITPQVARKLRELGIAVVGVSFDGAEPATHDAVRGNGSFHNAVIGLKALRTEGIRAQMEVVLSRANAEEAVDFISLAGRIGASEVNFSAMTAIGRGIQRKEDLLTHSMWLELIGSLRDASRSASIPVTPNCAFAGTCCANVEPHLTCEGWMTPCYLSDVQLFHVLRVRPETMARLLGRGGAKYHDICGRRAWTHAS